MLSCSLTSLFSFPRCRICGKDILFSYSNVSHHIRRIHRTAFKEYAEDHAVFGPDNEQETGCFEDAVVAVKSDVNGHHKDNAATTTVILTSREAPASQLFSDYPLFDPPPQSISGHFAHSSILFQPPPHPNLPIARKSRAFPLVNDATFSGNSNSHSTLPSIASQSYSSVVSDTSQPGATQHEVNYSMTKTTISNFAETSTLSTAPAPAWYDGNTFSCLQCGYGSCSLGSYETHVRSQHGMEPADFSTFAAMGSAMYRCECCMQQLYHEESTIRHSVHSHLDSLPLNKIIHRHDIGSLLIRYIF
jgi:hypothetical protein